jgi:outer membrane usher protein
MSAPSDLLLCVRARRGPAPVALSPLTWAEGANDVLGSAAFLALAASQTAGASAVGSSPAADAVRPPVKINPTKRTLRFIVPVTDGPTYLGDVTLAVSPDDSLAVQADRLLQMLEPILKPEVFARLKAAASGKTEISAGALGAEHITLTYDSEKLALAIGIPVSARRNESVSLRSSAFLGKETLEPAGFSGFVNFRSAMDFVERGSDQGILAPVSAIDGALRAFGVVAEGEGYLSLRKEDPLFRRTGSRLVYDDLKNVIRFTTGDIQPFARGFQSTPTVAGISAQRLYNVLEPWQEFRSTGSQSFTVTAPSMVETIVNGRSVERKLLQPGNYTLQDFPLAEGSNNVRLIIQDEGGKQRVVDFDLYSNQRLLQPGATEFSAFAGVYSTPTDAGIDYSRHWAMSGFVRKGITQQFTAGANVQADAEAQQVGVEILFGSDFGLFGVQLSASRRTNGDSGYAGEATFEKVVQSFSGQRSLSVRGAVEVRSPYFATPGALLDREPIALRASAGFAITLGRDTFVAADAQYSRDRVQNSRTYSLRGTGGLSISDTMSVIADAEWNKSPDRNERIFRIGIRKRLGFRGQAQADVDNHGAVHASYQTSHGVGVGSWSTSVDVDRTNNGVNLNGQGTLLTNRFELGASQFGGYEMDGHNISEMRTTLRAGTSISFADGTFAIGRPIQQAFLIASPHRSLHGDQVVVDPHQGSEQSKSGALGAAVDGDLSAYSPRTLIYDVPKAPPGYDLGAGNVQVIPPYKAGYHLEVGSDYHLLVIGRLLDRNGEPVSLLAGKAIDLKAPKRPAVTMFTSRGGKFGVQGLRAGKWRIEMPTEGHPAIYEIEIKDDPSGTVRLGDLRPVGAGGAK